MIFKKKSMNIIFLATIASLLMFSGCIRSEAPKDLDILTKAGEMGFEQAEKNATFYIAGDAAGLIVEQITSLDGATKEVRALRYRFLVCLKEKASARKLQGFKFKINSSQGENPNFSKIVTTNEDGCLVWIEDFRFDVGKPNPQPVVFLRKIKSVKESSRQGEVSFIFQLFPWGKVLSNQAYLPFYFLKGEQRKLYRGQIQRLFLGYYNPKKKLNYNRNEKTQLYVSHINYNLTGIPFSVIKKDLQPTRKEIEEKGLDALLPGSDYVLLKPDRNNPNSDKLLLRLRNNNQSPYALIKNQKAFDGLHVDLVLNIKLAQFHTAVNGNFSRNQKSGRFKVLPYLYATDYNKEGDRVLLNSGMESLISKINKKGDLNLHYKGILPYAPTSGNVQLALQITPMNNNLSKYEVIEELFDIGTYSDIIGKKNRIMEHPENFAGTFDFNKHAKESVGYEKALNRSHLRSAEPYNFTLANVKFKTIEAGETANRRTVIFNVKTCVGKFNFQSKILQKQEFKIISRHFKNSEAEIKDEIADNENKDPDFKSSDYKDIKLFSEIDGDKIRTDSNGCLSFIDKIRHKYYKTERLVRRKYFIQAKDDPQGFTKELILYLNPWDEKFGTLGTDARSVSQTFLKELNQRDKIEPRFYIQDFRYETLRFRYEIDKSMNLVVKKTILLRLYPKVLRYSNILQGINSIFPIRDGIYLLKMAYQKDYLDPAARGIRIRSRVENTNPSSSSASVTKGPLIERLDGNGKVLRTDEDSAKVEASADLKGETLDGSQKVLPPYDPSRKVSISIVKKLVRVNAGFIITPIEFSVKDLRLLRIRSQVFVQIENVNQTRLQLVNIASREIEKAMQISKGTASEISNLPKSEQRKIIQQKVRALDVLAKAIPDDLEYTKNDISELLKVFSKPEVISAFSPFIKGGKLNSVATMIGEEKSDKDFLESIVELAFLKQDDYIKEIKIRTEKLRKEVINLTGEKNTDQKVLYNYASSEEFRMICGPTHKGYDQCVTENKAKNPDFNEQACRCYDELSNDYKDFSTVYGDTITKLNNDVDKLQSYKEFMSASTILNKVMARSKNFFSNLSNKDIITKLLLNDFTLAQAKADISDLDLLRDKVIPNIDIQKRTFVGPLTLLSNANGGSLRPTDNLDEAYCVTDDCNSLGSDPLNSYSAIKNFNYERSPYHGSIAHFSGKHVDDFIKGSTIQIGSETKKIPSYKEFNKMQAKILDIQALLPNFIRDQNLNYVSLKNNKLKDFICEDPKDADFKNNSNNCFKDYTDNYLSTQDLIEDYHTYSTNPLVTKNFSKINDKGKYSFDLNFLKSVVKKDHGGQQCTKKIVPASYAVFNEIEYGKFCDLMIYGIFAKNYLNLVNDFIGKVKEDKIEYKTTGSFVSSLLNTNIVDVYSQRGGSVIPIVKPFVDRLYDSCITYAKLGKFNEPLNIERKYRIEETGGYYYLGGKSLNITLGQQVGIAHKIDSNKTHRIDSGAITNYLPPVLKSYNYSYTSGEGFSMNRGLSIQQATFLVMQNAEFDIELKKYEQCLVVRWATNFLRENKYIFFENPMLKPAKKSGLIVDGQTYDQYIIKKLLEGLMVCSGDSEKDPIAIRETYYYFTQNFIEGDMQDIGDNLNHPWLLSLRGVRDFETFLISTLSNRDIKDSKPERYVEAEELVGMGKLFSSDFATENLDGTSHEDIDKFKRNVWPLSQLIRTYRRISPTFPGLYTQLNRKEYEVVQWPWAESVPGQKFEQNQGLNCYSKE